ncbi:hypothetical protein OAW23_03785 [Flavobacteriales bacterium]|nr:hypothetical protein [Flavobacteriales bacterium]
MKIYKILFTFFGLIYISAFFMPTYDIAIFGTFSTLLGWETCIFSFRMLIDSFFKFETLHFTSGICAVVANGAVIFALICLIRKSKKIKLLRIVSLIGFTSTIWWLVHEMYDGEISNLLVGYYIWISSVGGVLFTTVAQVKYRLKANNVQSNFTIDRSGSNITSQISGNYI